MSRGEAPGCYLFGRCCGRVTNNTNAVNPKFCGTCKMIGNVAIQTELGILLNLQCYKEAAPSGAFEPPTTFSRLIIWLRAVELG